MLMHVSQALEGLEHDRFDLGFGEVLPSVLHELVNVLFHVFKNEIEIVINSYDLFQLHDIDVVQFPERLNFPESHAFFPTIELLFHFLNGDLLVGLLVGGLDNGSIGSIS